MDTFSGFNFQVAWFVMQPYYMGVGWLFSTDLFVNFGSELTYVGFTSTSVVNVLINQFYNIYMTTLGVTNYVVNLTS